MAIVRAENFNIVAEIRGLAARLMESPGPVIGGPGPNQVAATSLFLMAHDIEARQGRQPHNGGSNTMTPSMRVQAAISGVIDRYPESFHDMPRHVWEALHDAATMAAYDSAQYEIDKARGVMLTHRELEALARYLRIHGDLDHGNGVALTSIMLDTVANARRFWDTTRKERK